MIEIEDADNGWIVKYPSHNIDGETIEVIEFPESADEGDKEYEEAVQRLLYTLKEGLGIFGSKHNKYKTFVEVVNQDES